MLSLISRYYSLIFHVYLVIKVDFMSHNLNIIPCGNSIVKNGDNEVTISFEENNKRTLFG